jgi:hypothetical protein
MAHARKDTRVASPEWWKHLRPYNKRLLAKAERRAAKDEIAEVVEASAPDVALYGLGLGKDPRVMEKLRAEQGESVVSRGMYCYDEKGTCPYWDKAENGEDQNNGYCWLMCKGDWDADMDLLWDQCKACGLKNDWAPEGTLPVEAYDEVAE